MTSQVDGSSRGADAVRSHDVSALLATALGAGLAAARHQPHLLGLLDQHAAVVRDSLRGDDRAVSAVALARYARGVRDAAREHGWLPPEGPVDWASPDWVLTRLLAVHALTRGGWPAIG